MLPTFRLKINHKDKTRILRKSLQSLTFKDADGTQSDELTLQLIGDFPRPQYQDQIELWIGYEGTSLMFCGLFKVQTSKRTPHQLTVTATGADFASRLKEKRNQSYSHIRLSELVAEIAQRHDLKVKTDGNDVLLEHLSQTDESDLHLLKRLAKEHHSLFSIKNKTLLFLKKKDSKWDTTRQKKANLPSFQIPYDQFTSLEITHSNKTRYASCQLTYHDSKTNACFQATAGQGQPIHQVKKRCTSQAEAQSKAQAALEQINQGTKQGSFQIRGQEIYAGGILKLTGTPQREDDGDYSIQSLTHELSVQGGWKIRGEFQN